MHCAHQYYWFIVALFYFFKHFNSVVCYEHLLNFGMLKFLVGLCVCVYLWVCVYASVFLCACLWVLHDFVYIQFVCWRMFLCFFSHIVCEYDFVSVNNLWIFNICECCLCLCAFQTNTPAGGRHDRETGRRIHHGGPQPQRRPLMVPSIGQYGQVAKEKGREIFLCHSTTVCVKTSMSFSVSPDHFCVY